MIQESSTILPNSGKIYGDNPLPCRSNEIESDGVLDMTNHSDATTVEDPINESDLPDAEDRFAYLEGLDSGNLMKFSQQSVLQELMKTEYMLGVKPDNLNILPTFEEHDIGGYKFQINLNNVRKGRSNWIYSEPLNKVYIRMNDICNVEASFTPKLPVQQLCIRVLLCFVKEVSEPVLRCQNHMSVDTESRPLVRRSLLRCENPSAEYCGNPQGKSINDRLSILIPLSSAAKQGVGGDNIRKQTIALKFTCQNSCIGRKETSVIFLLESASGEILSQRVVDVKMCSCPKRDKSIDERNLTRKRKMEEADHYVRKKKLIKRETKSPFSSHAETTRDTNGSDIEDVSIESNSNDLQNDCDFNFQSNESGRWRLVLEGSNKENALPFLEIIFKQMGFLAFQTANNPKCYADYTRHYRKIKKIHDELSKLTNY